MGNKRFDYYCAYIDPDEIKNKTPAKRLYSVWPVIQATSVSRAVGQFWKQAQEEEDWGKKDIVLIGVMPGGLTPNMKKDYDPALHEQLQEDMESEDESDEFEEEEEDDEEDDKE